MQDSQQLRDLLVALLPGIAIQGVPAASGQRVVYFIIATGCDVSIPNGPAVLKVSGGLSPAAITYLQREIRLLGQISSNYFPKLYYNEVFTVDPRTDDPLIEQLFVTVEEQIHGSPLSDVSNQFKEPTMAKQLIAELTRAGQFLWTLKPAYVHRDIKPANILIRSDRSICLIDLGIVREEGGAGVTNDVAPWGPCTPGYASPEQAKNDKMNITFKSDFFSIGVVAYELLSGLHPFQATPSARISEVLDNVVRLVPPRLKDAYGVSGPLSDLVEQLMEKEPYKRPRTPDILLEVIQSI